MKNLRLHFLIVLGVGVLLIAILNDLEDLPYSDPDKARGPVAAEQFAPVTGQHLPDYTGGLEHPMTRSGNGWRLEVPKTEMFRYSMVQKNHDLEGFSYEEEDFGFDLVAIRVTYPRGPADLTPTGMVTSRSSYFTPSGAPMDGRILGELYDQLEAHQSQVTWYRYENVPIVAAILERTGTTPFLPTDLHAYSRTMGGRGPFTGALWLEQDPFLVVCTRLPMWHPGPVTLVIQAMLGPVTTHRLAIEREAQLGLPGGPIRLKGFASGRWSARGGNPIFQISLRDDRSVLNSLFLAQHAPPDRMLPYRAIGQDGTVLYEGELWGALRFSPLEIPHPIEDIDHLALDSYARYERFFIHLDEVPGLPEENRDPDNLFEVTIPYVSMRNNQINRLIEHTTGLRIHDSIPRVYPDGVFPLARQDVTGHDLLAVYRQGLPEPGRMAFDQSGYLYIEASANRRFSTWLRNRFGIEAR